MNHFTYRVLTNLDRIIVILSKCKLCINSRQENSIVKVNINMKKTFEAITPHINKLL